MVPDKDLYADKDGKLTDDMSKAAFQVAVAGHVLNDRIARKYGLLGDLVSVDEPAAPRKMIGSIPETSRRKTEPNASSVKITKAEDKKDSVPPAVAGGDVKKPQEPAGAKAKKPAAKKEKSKS
jgi:hypothetical protein